MAESLMDKAVAIREQAVYHKRQARKHKQLARDKMAELMRFCHENGIQFVEAKESEDNGTNETTG